MRWMHAFARAKRQQPSRVLWCFRRPRFLIQSALKIILIQVKSHSPLPPTSYINPLNPQNPQKIQHNSTTYVSLQNVRVTCQVQCMDLLLVPSRTWPSRCCIDQRRPQCRSREAPAVGSSRIIMSNHVETS